MDTSNLYVKIQRAVTRTLFGSGVSAEAVRATRSAVQTALDEEHEAGANAAAREREREAESAAEHQRLAEILRAPQAAANWDQALHLALDTDLPPAAVLGALKQSAPQRLPGLALCNGHNVGADLEPSDAPDSADIASRVLDQHRTARGGSK